MQDGVELAGLRPHSRTASKDVNRGFCRTFYELAMLNGLTERI
jgi:hypothetical protein